MNGEYIITPGNIYYTGQKGGDRFKIDNQNKIKYKVGDKIEEFEDLIYRTDYNKKVQDFFAELGEITTEKGNLVIFKNTNGDNIYLYNTKTPIEGYDNQNIYSNILFENRQDQILKKTEDLCSFVLDSNIDNISKVAKLGSISNKSDFIQSMSNKEFIENYLTVIDEKNMEDIFLLGKGCHIGYYGKIYLYAFLEKDTKLIPIYFNEDNVHDFDISNKLAFDKISVIMKMATYEKTSLLVSGKIANNIMIFNKSEILEKDLQSFYNEMLELNNSHTKEEEIN